MQSRTFKNNILALEIHIMIGLTHFHFSKKPDPEPQPDNRDGNEFCIGVLNNFYADGVKWHDVACHHRKPTICQLN